MAEQKIIDVEPRHLKMIQSIFARNLPFKKVWAFGSRVKWTARPSSDLDCVVFGASDGEISKAQEAFDESEVPFEVQLLNWENIPEDFKENVKKEYFVVRRESDWGEFKLGDVLEKIIGGGTPSKSNPNYWGGNIPWASVKDMKDGQFNLSETIDRINIEGLQNSATNLIPKGNVIIATRMGLGRCFINKIDCAINQDLKALIPNKKITKEYLLWWLVSQANLIELMGHGTTVKGIRLEQLKEIPIHLPQLTTQQKIAGILSSYDDLIENNNRRIKILEEMAQMLYKEWFVDFKFPNHQNTKFIDSELGKIPEGWRVENIKNFGTVSTGKTPSTKNTDNFGKFMPFIKTPDMHSGIFCIETNEYLSESGALSQKNKILPPNSLCISCIGTAGVVSITTVESQTNQQINSVILKNLIQREFMYFALIGLKETIMQYGSTGATMTNLSKGKFEELKIILPEDGLVEKFNNITKSSFDQIKNLLFKNKNLKKTRNLLLPRLISGELSVENLEVKI
jgi:type I restriction enzyme S subunit